MRNKLGLVASRVVRSRDGYLPNQLVPAAPDRGHNLYKDTSRTVSVLKYTSFVSASGGYIDSFSHFDVTYETTELACVMVKSNISHIPGVLIVNNINDCHNPALKIASECRTTHRSRSKPT